MRRLRRLRREHVQTRRLDQTGAEPFVESVEIHRLAARGVDQERSRLHASNEGVTHEPSRLFGQRNVEGDGVASGEEVLEALRALKAERLVVAVLLVRVVEDDARVEAGEAIACASRPTTKARASRWQWACLPQLPRRISESTVGIVGLGRIGTATAQRLIQGDRVIGGGVRAVVRYVARGDAAPSRRRNIDVVVADADADDHAAALELFDDRRVEPELVPGKDGVRTGPDLGIERVRIADVGCEDPANTSSSCRQGTSRQSGIRMVNMRVGTEASFRCHPHDRRRHSARLPG